MRVFVIASLPVLLIAASEPVPQTLDNPAYSSPPERWQTIDDAEDAFPEHAATPNDEHCSDTITHARDASGQPPLLQREPASPEKPQAIYAVDRRQDGCSVMVMMGDPDDVRPLPLPAEGPPQVIPADAATNGLEK